MLTLLFRTVLRAAHVSCTVLRTGFAFGTVLHAALVSCAVLHAGFVFYTILLAALSFAPFCVPISFSCTVSLATFISRIVSRVLRRFPLHVAHTAWFYRRFAFSLAFAYRAVMLTAWSSHEPDFDRFGTQTALLST